MSETPRLGLPLLAAGQAQKHVTHNDALMLIDALVQLTVASRTQASAPSEPGADAAYIVPSDGAGIFAGRTDALALHEDGGWTFIMPRPGWQAWVMDEAEHHVWTGTEWRKAHPQSSQGADIWGVNAAADSHNRFVVSADASLFTHAGGDHRLTLNKSGPARTASLLFQDDWVGRAEIGLAGDNRFRLKVSADGADWREALVVEASGLVTLPASAWAQPAPQPNLLINGDFQLDQRRFGGGALAAGIYGYDRWKAHGGAAELTLAGHVLTLAAGTIAQVVETAVWGLDTLASQVLTLSVEAPSEALAVSVGSASGTILPGPGRRSVSLTTGPADNGDLTVTLRRADEGPVSFGRVKLELGTQATGWRARPEEWRLAARYCHVVAAPAAETPLATAVLAPDGTLTTCLTLPAPLRTASPAVTQNGLICRALTDAAITGIAASRAVGTLLSLVLTASAAATTTPAAALLVASGPVGSVMVEAEL